MSSCTASAGLVFESRRLRPRTKGRRGVGSRSHTVAFASFILLHAILFIRPGDMFIELAHVPLYLFALLTCTALSLPAIWRQLRPASLATNPITLCVLGIVVAAVLSNLVHLDFRDAYNTGRDCLTFGLYYFVLVGVVESPRRLRAYLMWVVFFIFTVCCLGLLIHFGYIEVQADAVEGIRAQSYREGQEGMIDDETGEELVLARLCGVGVYNNPNDLSRILVVGIILCFYCLADRGHGLLRCLWALPIVFFTYALQLTYSRGGFLALVTGIFTLIMARFGRARSLILATILLPLLLLLFAGRSTSIDMSQGTGQDRLRLWRDSFAEMKNSPVCGIGYGNLDKAIGLVAHNSFIQCYAELGIFGGTMFAFSCYLALWGPYRLGWYLVRVPNLELRRFRPYLLAIVAGSSVGMISSTRSYRVDTYMLLGLSAAYLSIIAKLVPASLVRMDLRLTGRMVVVSAICLLGFNLYVRLAAH
jgi:O-antigen ligase